MSENIASIIKWHEETFPEATLDGQMAKFNEEYDEWKDAKTPEESNKELADMFIVACGLARFTYDPVFFSLVHTLGNSLDLHKSINEKMKLNRTRQWTKGNGEYKHIGVDNG